MNDHLSRLFRAFDRDPEKTMYVIKVVLAVNTDLATQSEEDAYRRLSGNTTAIVRQIINDFTSYQGLFNIDHPAWQLGIDVTAEGPTIPDETSTHACLPEQLVYLGHYVAVGRGVSYKCSVCARGWVKIDNQYREDLIYKGSH